MKLKVNYCNMSPSGWFHSFGYFYREIIKRMDKEKLLELLKTNLKHMQGNAIIFSFEERTFKDQISFLNGGLLALLQALDFYL